MWLRTGTIWLGLASLVGPFVGVALTAVTAVGSEAPYKARPLRVTSETGPLTWTCRAEYAANTGYYYQNGGWKRVAEYEKQSRPATWIISLNSDGARVTDGQGNIGTYIVTKLDRTGITLVEAKADTSVQVITIDPSTSSFVYATQNAMPLWNRASTFTGGCE